MSFSIVKSIQYKGSRRDVKDILLEGEVVGYLYQASSEENLLKGIFRAVEDSTYPSFTFDIFVVEIIGGQYATDLLKSMVNADDAYFPNFVEGLGNSSIISVYATKKEARKYARKNLGCREALHLNLSSYIFEEMRKRADRVLLDGLGV